MKPSPTQYALREMRRMFSAPMTQVSLLAVVVILGISGPFGTQATMSFGPRLAYWAITAPLTFALGVFVSSYIAERLRKASPSWIAPAAVALGTAISVTALVLALNWLAFGSSPFDMASLTSIVVSVMATAAVIALVLYMMSSKSAAHGGAPALALPAILDRLELSKRGKLISLTVQDHYVEVVTDKGASLLLMRLSDAIRETAPIEGLQVHRSHWVARAQVVSAVRQGDKAMLTLTDGREIPASRSNIKALKDAGLLPR